MACVVTMSKNLRLSTKIVSNGDARVKWLTIRYLIACAVVLTLALAGSATVHAAPFDPAGRDWEGYADFVKLLRDEVGGSRVVVTNQIDWNAVHANDALLLVYPDHSVDSSSVGAFVRAGGRLALLDDFGAGDDLLGSFGIQRVPLPARPALALRDNPDLPIADPGPNPTPLTQGVDRVVTNHASGLRQPLLNTVLRVRAADGSEVPLALSASSGDGRLVAVGDPSIVINSMLRYAGNREFAKNLAHYLTDGRDAGPVHVVVRSFTETGAYRGAGGPGHEWFTALRQAGASVGQDGLPGWVLYWLTFIVTSLVLAWIIPRTARTYRSLPPRFTRPTPTLAQGGAAGHAAALGAAQAYRGHAMIEWRRAFVEDLTGYFGLPGDASSAEVVRRIARLGAVDAEAIRAIERLLLRMAEIDTMIAARQTHALEPIRDDEVLAAGRLVRQVLGLVHGKPGQTA